MPKLDPARFAEQLGRGIYRQALEAGASEGTAEAIAEVLEATAESLLPLVWTEEEEGAN